MNSLSSIASSALSVASTRLTRSAQNVANVNTNDFTPQRSIQQSLPNGGVTSTSDSNYGATPSYDLTADEVLGSSTDPISETVDQLGALQQFKAAISLLKTDQETTQSLLDIKA